MTATEVFSENNPHKNISIEDFILPQEAKRCAIVLMDFFSMEILSNCFQQINHADFTLSDELSIKMKPKTSMINVPNEFVGERQTTMKSVGAILEDTKRTWLCRDFTKFPANVERAFRYFVLSCYFYRNAVMILQCTMS